MAEDKDRGGGLPAISLQNLSSPEKRAFIEAYQEAGTITGAAKSSGVTARTHYNWIANDPSYRYVFKNCIQLVRNIVEDSLVDGFINGRLDPVYHQGECVGYRRKFSDATALAWLKARFPDEFSGEGTEVNVGIQNNVEVPDANQVVAKLISEHPHLIDVLHDLDVEGGGE